MPPQSTDELLEKIQKLEAIVAHRTDQLIASTARAYSFLDSINKGFMLCDIGGELVLANQALRYILASKFANGKQELEMLDVDNVDRLMRPDLELITLIKHCTASRQTIERDDVSFGSRILHTYITPFLSNDVGEQQQILGVIVLIEDVTEQKMLDRAKDEFLSIAAHELRTPLTAIRGNTSIIQKYYVSQLADPDMSQMIADIHESSIRLIDIVNDFLDVAAMEQGKIEIKPEIFPVYEVAQEAARELENLCTGKGIRLICDVSLQSAPTVIADKQRIKQVVINLIGNAVKFTDKGSITLSAASDDGFVCVAVTDTGKGMSSESQQLLFRKFQQAGTNLLTRDTSKGTGLGLYISKLIIGLSGGAISLARSELGVGSSFVFTIPRSSRVNS